MLLLSRPPPLPGSPSPTLDHLSLSSPPRIRSNHSKPLLTPPTLKSSALEISKGGNGEEEKLDFVVWTGLAKPIVVLRSIATL